MTTNNCIYNTFSLWMNTQSIMYSTSRGRISSLSLSLYLSMAFSMSSILQHLELWLRSIGDFTPPNGSSQMKLSRWNPTKMTILSSAWSTLRLYLATHFILMIQKICKSWSAFIHSDLKRYQTNNDLIRYNFCFNDVFHYLSPQPPRLCCYPRCFTASRNA